MVVAILVVMYCVLMRMILGKLLVATGYSIAGTVVEELCLMILAPFLPLLVAVGALEAWLNK